MAVQLSAALWLMNNEVRNIVEDTRKEYYLKEEDRKKLAELREEYYRLTENSHFVNDPNAVISGPNVLLHGLIKEIQVCSDGERAYNLFEEVADIFKKYGIEVETYRGLGKVFKEMGREPKKDTKSAIEYAAGKSSRLGLERLFWESTKKS